MFCVTLVVLYVSTILCVGSPVFDLIREAHFSLFNEPGEIVRTPERRRNALEIWASIFARITEIYSILFLCLRMAYLEHFSTPPWKDLHFGGLLVISLAMRCPGRLGVSRLWQSRVMIVLSFVASSMIRVHVPKAMAPTNTLVTWNHLESIQALFREKCDIRHGLPAFKLVLLLEPCSFKDV